jgi:hypothetical protein
MNGWSGPPSSGGDPRTPPVVGWDAPSDEGLAVGGTMSAGWALTRAHLGDLAAVAAIPIGLWTLTLLPLWVATTQVFDAWVRFFTETDFSQYAGDPEALRRDMDAIFRPATGLSAVAGLSAGLGVAIAIVGAAAVAQATLDAARGRDITIGRSFGAVADHAAAIVGPAIALGAAYVLVFVPFGLSQGSVTTGAGTPATSIVYLGLSVLIWVVFAAVIYFAVRWAVVLQVILAEDRGLAPALTRSSALSQGVRIRIAVVLLAATFVVGLALSIPTWIAAIVGWLVTGSVAVGMGVYLLGIAIGGLVGMPFIVAVLTVIYDRRVAAVDAAAAPDPSPSEPAG